LKVESRSGNGIWGLEAYSITPILHSSITPSIQSCNPLNPQPEAASPPPAAKPAVLSPRLLRQLRLLCLCIAVLMLCFARPLFSLARFTLHSELYSHILLIPFVSLYLAWLKKNEFLHDSEPDRKLAALPLAAGLLSSLGFLALHSRLQLAPVDSLAWNTFSFFLLFIGACCLCLGRPTLRALAFPLGFLILLVPFPVIVRDTIESFLQHRSADAAELLFGLAGTPLLRHGVDFQLPGFSLQVAPECSGIRSTLVLFITSLVAGQLFLRSPWKRALFALAVIPLGILRNAFRIVTIGELCIHVDPGFIDSPIHRRGGPVFFVISMIPFLLLLYYLRKTDARKHKS
jgi:exosortase C (VPDSG-CTERM-specific)